jgi:hypothetical protein
MLTRVVAVEADERSPTAARHIVNLLNRFRLNARPLNHRNVTRQWMGLYRRTIMGAYLDIDADDMPAGSASVKRDVVGDGVTQVKQRKHGSDKDQ